LWVPETRFARLPDDEQPFRVWTLYGEGRDDPKAPPALPIAPTHNAGAFLEDRIHDWNVTRLDGVPHLRYYSRVMPHSCWVLVEYAEHRG
jgi:hypothetical protein